MAAVAGAQAPELAQQYSQRIGGALQELSTIVTQFDADAARNGLSREEALQRYAQSADSFFQDRGRSMRAILDRFASLTTQAARLREASPVSRPLAMIEGYDEQLLRGAWGEFRPAVPVTMDALAWAAVAFGIGALAISGPAGASRGGGRKVRRVRSRRAAA